MKDEMLPQFKNPEKIAEIMNMGFIYSYGRDRSMRPIWIVNCRKLLDSGLSNAELYDA